MSTTEQPTYRSYLLRLRNLAKIALGKYGITQAKLKLKTPGGNGLYQVTISSNKSKSNIHPGRYALRLHQPGYMKPEAIISEMDWLSSLREAEIDVPNPFRNLNGEWLTLADGGYEIPQARTCTLLSWTEGRLLMKNHKPHHMKSLGRVMGKMHEQSLNWKKPKGFTRPHWDWEGLFGDGFGYGVPAKDAWEAIPQKYQGIFNDTLRLVQEASQELGKGKSVYGLIHADLGVDGNVAFHAGKARPFDFDDCGFGYWMFDLGVALAHYLSDCEGSSPKMLDSLIEGYQETSPLPESNLETLDLFIAARYAQLIYFWQASSLVHPQHRVEAMREVNHYGKYLKRILKKLS